jgi:hypothetical protein
MTRARMVMVLILLSLPALARPLERPGGGGITVIADLPGWWHAGTNPTGYSIDIDRTISHGGKASARLKSVIPSPTGFGSLMQISKPDKLRGKRVRFSAWIKTEKVQGHAGLWMRVDGKDHDPASPLATDSMSDRPISGTRGWQRYEIVLDVANDAGDVAFGAFLSGVGTAWIDDLTFEFVDQTVPVTAGAPAVLPAEPQNLNFEG